MTSSIVNFLIEKYLCFFVEIDANEIDASILNGTISLNNLRIKPSFFDSINLPDIEIINGYIGALDIKIFFERSDEGSDVRAGRDCKDGKDKKEQVEYDRGIFD